METELKVEQLQIDELTTYAGNAKTMELMKGRYEDALMARCVVSTIFGETLDASIFITVAFAGSMPVEALLTMVVAQAGFKTAYEIIVYPLTRRVIGWVKGLDE